MSEVKSEHMDVDNVVSENMEEDEVVQEIDVYLSQQLAQHLYLFQYPIRTHSFGKNTGPTQARIKPKSQIFELDIPLETNAPTYNREKGEELGLGVNDDPFKTILDERMGTKQNKASLMNKQTLASSLVPAQTNYMVGAFRNGALYMSPVRGAVQFRPSLKYLDKIDEKIKVANKKVLDEENKDLQVEEVKAKAVQVQVRNADSNQTATLRKSTLAQLQRQAEEEPWIRLQYFDEESNEAYYIYEKMFSGKKEPLVCKTTTDEFIDRISAFNTQL
ncbi:hypothetical protein K493DRAFT_253077 [Basidiobolus meristosporus CBS 931.73]|uniref:DNA-directed RNA polymerase III subunit Rpc5 n=1 Tax=Basidiobolus meristosporus CBS 931.73 TaxID=1314790 RepID=A0A1Y1Z427_9FUNG|nr:hypothetical protein K493DRAFT_253077 [Basidiobolus meristosporus CBS 931.73]|eukprot:ORY05032.1 hypothetical protein K493DRAFT_253077 [Basidiobolus meristosporus CBS 931.73]